MINNNKWVFYTMLHAQKWSEAVAVQEEFSPTSSTVTETQAAFACV